MALPAAKAQAANQTAQARADKKAKEEKDKGVKSSKGGDVEPSNGLTPADLPPLPTEFQPTSNGTDYDGWELVWQDQFDGHRLDPTKWSVDIDCRHQELQCYTKRHENVYVRDGRLFLHAHVHPDGYTPSRSDECTRENDCMATKLYTSGRVKTKSLAKFRYGRIEIRARMPRGQFLWPTLWMLPEDEVHGDWAASGEIDILETTGTDPRTFSSTVHFGGVAPDNKFISSGVQSLVNTDNVPIDLSARFRLYRLDWTPKYLRTFFEGQKVLDIDLQRKFGAMYKKKGAPFDEDFYLLMNMAVGGEFFGGKDKKLNTTMADSWERPILEVDYVRVFRMIGKDDTGDDDDDERHVSKQSNSSSESSE